MLSLLVSIWFQVLFHSPPGVLFTFPSRYYTLSVTKSYLALRDGPRIFPPDSTCPVVLWIPTTLGIVNLLSFPPVNEMFQFTGFPSVHYLICVKILHLQCSEFPHSEICGSTLIYSSPQLIAVSHVLLRRLVPRHPPYALRSLIV